MRPIPPLGNSFRELISGIPGWEAVGVLRLPGMLLAGVVFPEDVHSDHGLMWYVLAIVMNVLLFAFPVLWLSRLVRQLRRRSDNNWGARG